MLKDGDRPYRVLAGREAHSHGSVIGLTLEAMAHDVPATQRTVAGNTLVVRLDKPDIATDADTLSYRWAAILCECSRIKNAAMLYLVAGLFLYALETSPNLFRRE